MTTALDLCHGKAIDGLRWLAVLYAADRIGLYHHRRVASQHYSLAGQLLAFRRINRAGCDVLYKSVLVEQLSSSEGRNESVVEDRLKRNQQNGRHERMHLTLKKEAGGEELPAAASEVRSLHRVLQLRAAAPGA